MKFELNDYHRNVSDEEFLHDVQSVASILGKDTVTTEEYTANGKYHHSTITRRFGSWKKVLQLSGLETKGHNFQCDWSTEEVIEDIKKVASVLKKGSITAHEYDEYGTFFASTLVKKFGSWNRLIEMAGLSPSQNRDFSSEDLLQEIERVWILLGRQPTSTDIKNGISKYSLQSYSRRFGGWRGALQAFVDWVNTDDGAETEQESCEEKPAILEVKATSEKTDFRTRKTPRDINLRLRFRVMQRDNFKCCMCGASPAKNPAVELHIDHIIPWAKGGETTFDNLQTLCSKCNLGKSDLLLDENT